MKNDLHRALLRADPRLSRYDPLERILLFDDFARGFQGWQTYFPDYDGWEDHPGRYAPVEPLRDILDKSRRDPSLRVDRRLPIGPRGLPMLGSWGGTYALKVPTLAQAGHKAFAQKRLGSPWRGKFRLECAFTFQTEASDLRLGETDVAAIYLTFDVMDAPPPPGPTPRRWWPALRYLNAEGGRLVQKWQYNQGSAGVKDGPWRDLPDGGQKLGFDRSATKNPWHPLRFTFDLERREYSDFFCHGREFAVGGLRHQPEPPLAGWRASTDKCPGLIGTGFGIEAAADQRCFLFVDSILVSASEA